MKILTIATCVTILTATTASANKPTPEDFCEAFATASEAVMLGRQGGMSLSDSLAIADANPMRDLLRSVIMAAWQTPRYSTADYRERAVQEFRDNQHVLCLNTVGK